MDMKNMKHKIMLAISIVVMGLSICSCREADELPPLNEGYATTIILPDGVTLTDEEWDYLDALDEEYYKATK